MLNHPGCRPDSQLSPICVSGGRRRKFSGRLLLCQAPRNGRLSQLFGPNNQNHTGKNRRRRLVGRVAMARDLDPEECGRQLSDDPDALSSVLYDRVAPRGAISTAAGSPPRSWCCAKNMRLETSSLSTTPARRCRLWIDAPAPAVRRRSLSPCSAFPTTRTPRRHSPKGRAIGWAPLLSTRRAARPGAQAPRESQGGERRVGRGALDLSAAAQLRNHWVSQQCLSVIYHKLRRHADAEAMFS